MRWREVGLRIWSDGLVIMPLCVIYMRCSRSIQCAYVHLPSFFPLHMQMSCPRRSHIYITAAVNLPLFLIDGP